MDQNDKQPTLKRRSQRLIEAEASKKRLMGPDNTIRQIILTLPTEILLLIINNLPLPWKMSLALTCKSFTELTHRSTLPRLEMDELAEFLSALQKDIPFVFFCPCCYKLCPFDPHLDWDSQAHKPVSDILPLWAKIPFPHSCNIQHVVLSNQFHLLMSNIEISFMEANLVMSRHFRGFSHGIPLQSMERHESFEVILEIGSCVRSRRSLGRCGYRRHPCSMGGWTGKPKSEAETRLPEDSTFIALQKKKNTWRFFSRIIPKIIDEKLYIAKFFTISGPLVSEERLKKLIGSMSISICPHLTCTAFPSCCYSKNRIPELSRDYLSIRPSRLFLRDDGIASKFDPEQDSCPLCSTDYRISLDRGISDNETNLNISIYHCLGSCQSSNDYQWLSFVDHSSRSPGTINSRTPERGSIQRKWHEAP